MQAAKAFFSFAVVTDNSKHHEFSAYYQLDHRPENLALPGVIHGERWVRSPDCVSLSRVPDRRLEHFQYMTMYLLRAPIEQNRREWQDLGARAAQWGRRPDLAWTERPLLGWYEPIKGYANPRVLVSPDVVPLRPTKGLYVTVSDLVGSGTENNQLCAWYDREFIPAIVDCHGVAGAWTFVSEDNFADRTPGAAGRIGGVRIHLYYLDQEPLDFMREFNERRALGEIPLCPTPVGAAEELRFAGPLRSITPWQWTWFDGT